MSWGLLRGLRRSLGALGGPWGVLWTSGGVLWASWGSWGRLGGVLGLSGASLGGLRELLWEYFGTFLALFGALVHLRS